jgi:hypothetical protein
VLEGREGSDGSPHRSPLVPLWKSDIKNALAPCKIRTMKQLVMKTNAQEFMFMKLSLFSVCWGADDVLGVSTLTQMVSEFPWAMMLACTSSFSGFSTINADETIISPSESYNQTSMHVFESSTMVHRSNMEVL